MRRSRAQLVNSKHLLFRTRPSPYTSSSPIAFRTTTPLKSTPRSQAQIRQQRVDYTYSRIAHQPYIPPQHITTSSYTSYTLILLLSCGSVYLYDHLTRAEPDLEQPVPSPAPSKLAAPTTSHDPFFTTMPIQPGHRGNLTAEQEAKLRELWVITLKTFGVADPTHANSTTTTTAPTLDDTPTNSEPEGGKEKKKKSRMSIFSSRKHNDTDSSSSHSSHKPSIGGSSAANPDDSDDKYGQVKEYHQILSSQTPESLRSAFWSMVKADHPDALLLRFLRARKWDVPKALVMLISTMSWRGTEMHVDDDVMYHGEAGALRDSKSTDANVKREGHDFLEQMRLGKSFLHGTDKEGRPLCFVRARLHHGGDQTERSMERYTVYVIETARLVLRPPVETAVSCSSLVPKFLLSRVERVANDVG